MDKVESIATNTLLIPDIPASFFGCDEAMLLIHDAFAAFGPLYSFVPMKGFRRLMIIFQETVHAQKAKKELDKHSIVYKDKINAFPDIITFTNITEQETKQAWLNSAHQLFFVRVYFGQHFQIHVDPNSTSLQVPQFQRNLLISPPGSPCEGWEQIEEDAPNQAVLASDLMHAAEISDYELDQDELELSETLIKVPKTISIVCSKGSTPDEDLPAITVQDWDTNHDHLKTEQEIQLDLKKKMNKTLFAPTSLPPS